MALILVEHRTAAPALYGAMTAVVAAERGAEVAHLPARFDTGLHPDAIQHVASSGALVPSGLLWVERLTGRDVGPPSTIEAVLRGAAGRDVAVPFHPGAMSPGLGEALLRGARAAGVRIDHLTVDEDASGFAVRAADAGSPAQHLGHWSRDAFGRFVPATAGSRIIRHRGPLLRIALVGTRPDHRDVYPGALAALGDAADGAGLGVEVVFLDPTAVRPGEVEALLAEVDGLLLPGGSDMANVPGQILMARGALEAEVPTVGLCLGMQTMTTAFAQSVLGEADVNLAEANPHATHHTFIAMAGAPGLPRHRLGEAPTVPVAGTLYGDLMGAPARERFNHRYRLNPVLEPALATSGLRVSARDETGAVVDAVEVAAHPFFVGLQGHPELRSRPESPHPLLSAFLRAVRGVMLKDSHR